MTASPPPAAGPPSSQNPKLFQTETFSTLLKRCSIVYLCAVKVSYVNILSLRVLNSRAFNFMNATTQLGQS